MVDLTVVSERLQAMKKDLEAQLAQDLATQLALVNETIALLAAMPDEQKFLDNLTKLTLI